MFRTKRRKVRPARLTGTVTPGAESRASVLDASERAILQAVERGEWARVPALPAAKARYGRYAKMTLRRLHKA
ncbi:MAG: hypothetical protein ACRD2N_02995 [Vicinamibacterales bacterium]